MSISVAPDGWSPEFSSVFKAVFGEAQRCGEKSFMSSGSRQGFRQALDDGEVATVFHMLDSEGGTSRDLDTVNGPRPIQLLASIAIQLDSITDWYILTAHGEVFRSTTPVEQEQDSPYEEIGGIAVASLSKRISSLEPVA